MYIIELIVNFLKGKKYKKLTKYDPLEIMPDDFVQGFESCEHLFMPLDSSNEMFACKYCGLVVPRSKLKDKNIFK